MSEIAPAQPAARAVPAPKPRRHRSLSPQKTELTRSEIVTAAIAEFMEVGIAKTTMDKIAKRANLAKGTLYLHFASKEDLLLGALEVTFTHTSLPDLNSPREAGEPMRDYMIRLFVPSMERFHTSVRADLARLVLGEAKSFPALAHIYQERIFLPWHLHFEKLFKQAIKEGDIQGILPTTAAMLLGAPFWVSLARDSLDSPLPKGCQPAELARAQIEALFGQYGT